MFPEVQVCPSDDQTTAFIVIRIPQSQLMPHAIRGNTQVYVRTDISNEPEELATLDRVRWLTDRRQRSQELEQTILSRSAARFHTLCERAGITLARGEVAFSMGRCFHSSRCVLPRSCGRPHWKGYASTHGERRSHCPSTRSSVRQLRTARLVLCQRTEQVRLIAAGVWRLTNPDGVWLSRPEICLFTDVWSNRFVS